MKRFSVCLGMVAVVLLGSRTIFGEIAPVTIESLTEQAQDTDNNSLYDSLAAEIVLDVKESMLFTLEGSLFSGDMLIAKAYKSSSLDNGINTVVLDFEGKQISQSQYDGPYRTSIIVYDQHRQQAAETAIDTLSYRHDEFENQ